MGLVTVLTPAPSRPLSGVSRATGCCTQSSPGRPSRCRSIAASRFRGGSAPRGEPRSARWCRRSATPACRIHGISDLGCSILHLECSVITRGVPGERHCHPFPAQPAAHAI